VRALTIVLTAALVIAGAALLAVAVRGTPPPATPQQRADAVGATLRCPACEDLSVVDSPSAIAREIRSDIARRLRAGQSSEAIRAFYVDRYGPWILLSPPRSGVTLFAWLLPALLLAGGLVLLVVSVRRWTRREGAHAGDRPADGSNDHDGSIGSDGSVRPVVDLPPADRRLLDRALAASAEDPE
jgi:cytochrome c-type biogenesis protein CcmH